MLKDVFRILGQQIAGKVGANIIVPLHYVSFTILATLGLELVRPWCGLSHVIRFGQKNVWVCGLVALPLSREEHGPDYPVAQEDERHVEQSCPRQYVDE